MGLSEPIVYILRKATFSASHRLHSSHLSDEANRQLYGPCNNPNGHGHNYIVEVTIRGPVDQKTGMVMNLTELRDHMDHVIMKKLDHKNLDLDVSFFKTGITSTVENVCIFIWDNLKLRMARPELLYEVRVWETDKNSAFYRGRLSAGNSISRPQCGSMSSDSD